jgi:hypothetical protein
MSSPISTRTVFCSKHGKQSELPFKFLVPKPTKFPHLDSSRSHQHRANSTRTDGVDHAEQILSWLKQLAKNGDNAAVLNNVKYMTCITAWMTRKNYTRAAKLLEMMADDYAAGNRAAVADCKTVEKVVKALCEQNKVNQADALLRHMWTMPFKSSDNEIWNISHIINAWGQIHQLACAEVLLTDMQYLFEKGAIKRGPSKQDYWDLIAMYDKSKVHDRSGHIRVLKKKLEMSFTRGRLNY